MSDTLNITPNIALIGIARSRLSEAQVMSLANGMAADQAESRKKWLGAPVVVLTTGVGTSVFATLSDLGRSQVWIAIITGALSILAAILAGVQTFMNFGGSAQAHAKASVKYQALAGMYELLLIRMDANAAVELGSIDKERMKILEESPRVSEKLTQKARAKLEPRDGGVPPSDTTSWWPTLETVVGLRNFGIERTLETYDSGGAI